MENAVNYLLIWFRDVTLNRLNKKHHYDYQDHTVNFKF